MPIVDVHDFKQQAYIERDLVLISVSVGAEHRGEVVEIVNLFRGKVVDVAEQTELVRGFLASTARIARAA